MSTLANAKPVCWASGDMTDASILRMINGLPTRNNQAPFTTITSALAWVAASTVFNGVSGVLDNIVTNGLVLSVDAGQKGSYPGSGNTWYDLAAANDGVLTNGPIFNTGDGGSIVFDGVNDEVVLPISSVFNTPSVTFEVWANLQTINDRHILYVNWTGNSLEVNSDRSVTMFNYSNTAGQVGATTISGVFNWDSWVHFVGTYDDSSQTLRTYINGSLSATRTSTPSTSYGIYVHKISGTNFGGEVKGKISIVRHYNRAITASEVLQNYNATKSRFGL
jgi:hypothetical protein